MLNLVFRSFQNQLIFIFLLIFLGYLSVFTTNLTSLFDGANTNTNSNSVLFVLIILLNSSFFNLLVFVTILMFYFLSICNFYFKSRIWIATAYLVFIILPINYLNLWVCVQSMSFTLGNINYLLMNTINLLHPPTLYLSFAMMFCWNFFFKNSKLYVDFVKHGNSFFSVHLSLISVFTIFLGCWWAWQEGNWGGWWSWDSSEFLSLFLVLFCLLLWHSKKSVFFETTDMLYTILLTLITFLYYIAIQLNFTPTAHTFIELNSGRFKVLITLAIFICISYLQINKFLVVYRNGLYSFSLVNNWGRRISGFFLIVLVIYVLGDSVSVIVSNYLGFSKFSGFFLNCTVITMYSLLSKWFNLFIVLLPFFGFWSLIIYTVLLETVFRFFDAKSKLLHLVVLYMFFMCVESLFYNTFTICENVGSYFAEVVYELKMSYCGLSSGGFSYTVSNNFTSFINNSSFYKIFNDLSEKHSYLIETHFILFKYNNTNLSVLVLFLNIVLHRIVSTFRLDSKLVF